MFRFLAQRFRVWGLPEAGPSRTRSWQHPCSARRAQPHRRRRRLGVQELRVQEFEVQEFRVPEFRGAGVEKFGASGSGLGSEFGVERGRVWFSMFRVGVGVRG